MPGGWQISGCAAGTYSVEVSARCLTVRRTCGRSGAEEPSDGSLARDVRPLLICAGTVRNVTSKSPKRASPTPESYRYDRGTTRPGTTDHRGRPTRSPVPRSRCAQGPHRRSPLACHRPVRRPPARRQRRPAALPGGRRRRRRPRPRRRLARRRRRHGRAAVPAARLRVGHDERLRDPDRAGVRRRRPRGRAALGRGRDGPVGGDQRGAHRGGAAARRAGAAAAARRRRSCCRRRRRSR